VLVLLSGSPSKEWSVAEIYNSIRSSQASVAKQLALLLEQGILEEKERAGERMYRYCPKDEGIHLAIMETVREYQNRRIRVIEAIFQDDTGPIQGFADAFKFRKS